MADKTRDNRGNSIRRRDALKLLGGAGTLAVTGGAATGLVAGFPVPAVAKGEPVTVKVITVQQKTQEPYKVIERWCKALEDRSGGEVKTELYGSEAVPGGERDALEGVRALGIYDVCHLTTGILSTVQPKYGLTDLPFIFRDRDQAFKVVDGEIGHKLDQALIDGAGLKPLMRTYSLFRHTHLRNKQIHTVSDFDGVKIRSIQADIPIRMFQLLGANPTPMSATEVYTAIQTGVIDGWETPLDAHLAWKTYEVAPHTSLTGHQYVDVVLCAKNDFYQNLPSEIQTLFVSAANDLVDDHRQRMADVDKAAAAKLKELDCTVEPVDDKKPFQEAVSPIYEEVGRKVGILDMINQIRSM